MKRLMKTLFILALVFCFAMPAFAIKILPYDVPLQDLMKWDKQGATLKLSNPEGETLSVAWASTVDLWNYDGATWTFDLPAGDTFAFGKGVAVTGAVGITGLVTISAATGIDFTGAVTKGLDFANATLAFNQENAYLAIGTWSVPKIITLQTAHFVPIQVNLQSNTSIAADIAAARFRVNTGAANTLTSVNVLELRSQLAHNVAAHANLQVSTTVTGAVEVKSGEAIVAYFAFDGTAAMTNVNANPIIAIAEFKLNNTATTLTDMVFLESVNSTTCVNMLRLKSGAGTVTNMVDLEGGANVTSFINFKDYSGGTTLLKTGVASGTGVQVTISIAGTSYYLNAYPTQN